MKFKKSTIITCFVIGILPILTYLSVYTMLPNQIATSYDFAGNVTDYTSRNGVIPLMLLPFILFPVLIIAPKIDPKGEKYSNIAGFYQWFVMGMTAFISSLGILTLWQSMHPESQAIQHAVPAFVGIMFIALGNYMPKMKQTYTLGIKTPWTLANEIVWYKTHRLGSKCFTICGIVFLMVPFFLNDWLWLFIVCMVVIGVLPSVMSYVYYRREVQVIPKNTDQ